MFGTNPRVGRKVFADMPPNHLKVTSIFHTLQGEGPYAGESAIFLRLTHCNLDCSFCDTQFETGDVMSFGEIATRMARSLSRTTHKHMVNHDDVHELFWELRNHVLVITGGEPSLQLNVVAFIEQYRSYFRAVQVETNGILPIVYPIGTVVVCSPKCAEVDGKPTKYIKPQDDVLFQNTSLKFVMCADQNSPYSSVPDWAFKWRGQRPDRTIYVSPMNIYNAVPQKIQVLTRRNEAEGGMVSSIDERSTDEETISFWEPGLLNMAANRVNHEYAAMYCLQHGCRLNLQIHLYASLP